MPDGEEVLMMRASTSSPALDRSRKWLAAKCAGAKVPLRWTLMTASHSPSVMFTSMRSRRMPALLMSTSSLPNASIAVPTSFSAPAQSLMSSRSEEHTSELQSHRDLHSFPTRRSSDLVAEDAGVVDEHVELAERLDRGADALLGAGPVADVVGVGHRLATGGDDLVDHLLGGTGVTADAVHRAAEVVDHDARALCGEQQSVLAADATAGPGHDRYPSIADTHWLISPLVGRAPPFLGAAGHCSSLDCRPPG